MVKRILNLISNQNFWQDSKRKFWKLLTVGITLSIIALSTIILSIIASPTKAFSATIYVPDSYPTIQAAVDAANIGDTIIVDPGTYTENVTVWKDHLTIRSKSGPEVTTIDGSLGEDWCTIFCNTNSTVSGFTIKIGREAGIYSALSSPVIRNNIIIGSGSHGIECSNSSMTITGNIIKGNDQIHTGITCYGGSPTVTNNVITGCNEGIWLQDDCSANVINNTVVSGPWDPHLVKDGIGIAGSSPTIKNNIIVGDGTNTRGVRSLTYAGNPSSPSISYNDVWGAELNYDGCSPGTGDISADPLFVNPANNNYHLQPGSPCIDAGDPNILDSDGSRSDMGAYGGSLEPTPEDNPPTVEIINPPHGETISGTVGFQTYATDDHGLEKVEFYIDDELKVTHGPFGPDTVASTCNWDCDTTPGSIHYIPNGSHTFKAKAYDTAGQTSLDVISVIVDNVVAPNLLKKYAPILYLHPDEQFHPWGIYSMLDNSDLTNGETVPNPRLTDLESHNNENYELDLRDADAASIPDDPERWEGYSFLVYGRKTESSDYPEGIVLQYWFFYPYNNWFNTHEGDWEMIQILYSEDTNEPEQLTFAHHHTFTYPPHTWQEISTIEETHTKVFIARGSHGNWAASGDHPVGKINPLPDETSETGIALYPEGVDPSSIQGPTSKAQYILIDIGGEPSWVKWQGRWGAQGLVPPRSPGVKNGWDKWNKWDEPIRWMSDPPSWYYALFGSPGHLHVYDPYGNHVGLTETGEIEANIPGTCFYVPSFYSKTSEELVWINTSENLRFVIEGTGSGSFDFTFNRNLEEEDVSIGVAYQNVQITENTVATVDVSPENPMFVMEIDLNGDRIIDEVKYPNYIVTDDLTAVPMASFVIEHAKIDFKKKPDDDKVRVQGKLELDLDKGDGVDISEDVIVKVGPLSETITMVEKSKKGEKWEYKRPKNGEGDIKHMKINWKKGEFDIRMDKADLTGITNPVTISIQIGDDIGSETILMREKEYHWDYKAKTIKGGQATQSTVQPKFSLSQNYPNPSNPETTIEYSLAESCNVTLKIYNISGQLIKTLINEYQEAGFYKITWYGDNDAGQEVASGVYFYRIKAGDFVSTKKMVVLK